MKILITGLAGFIGFHLAKKLIEQGHEIVGIDNINDYYNPTLKRLRLSELNSKKFKFYQSDINKIDNFDQNFDLVINLAAQAGVRAKKEQEKNYINSNIYGFKNLRFELIYNDFEFNSRSYNNMLKLLVDPQTCGPLVISCSPIYSKKLIQKGPWKKIGFVSS